MKNKVTLSVGILFFLCTFWIGEAYSINDKRGTSSLIFLKLGVSARALGMGEAFSAQSDGVGSPFWNPASLSGVKGAQISLTHIQWFQDVTAEHFSSVVTSGENALGLGFSLGKVPDIQKRDEVPTTEPLALFDAHDFISSFSYARSWKEKIGFGLSVKWIYEKIDISSASGLAFDFGAVYSPFSEKNIPSLKNLKWGMAVLNLGSKIKFENESYSLPAQYKSGVSYSFVKEKWQSDFNFGLDVIKPRDDDMKVHLGGEYGLYQVFNLRLGYQLGYDEKDLSFGMGIKYRKYAIDYAFIPYKSDLGDVHCISSSVEF